MGQSPTGTRVSSPRTMPALWAVFLPFALLVAITLALVRLHDQRLEDALSQRHLVAVREAQRLVEAQSVRELALRAELIASNQAVTAYVVQALDAVLPGMEVDAASVADLLEERRQQLGLAMAGVLDAGGALVATTEALSVDFSALPAFAEARDSQEIRTAVVVDGNRVLLVAIQPLAAYGTSEAYLLVASALDREFAASIAAVGDAQTVVAFAPSGAAPVAAASSLALDRITPEALTRALAGEGQVVEIDGQPHRSRAEPLFGHADVRLIAFVPPHVDDSPLAGPRLPVRVGALAAVIGGFLLLWLYWNRVQRPLARLRTLVEQAAQHGDLHLQCPETGSRQVRALSAAFNALLSRLRG